MFSSNDSLVAKRTSYNVFSNDDITFKKNLRISFDLMLWDNNHLGYIFNVSDRNNNSYSLSYINTDNIGYLNLNIDRISNKLKIPLQKFQLEKRKWLKITVDFNLLNNTVCLFIDNKCYKAQHFNFEPQLSAKITFGKNQYYTEVPNMAIRNLQVSDNSSKYFFPLNEWKGNKVHNDEGAALGTVENPIWLINDSYFWKPVFNHVFNEVAGLNFDSTGQRLFMYKRDSLVVYNLEANNSTVIKYRNQLPVPLVLGKSIFNTKQNKCYVYEPFDIRSGQVSIAALDMNTLTWENVGKATFKTQRHHHNVFYNATQDSIFLFGGYGSFKYYNTFFTYNQTLDKWQQITFKGDRINPRFFSAVSTAAASDEILLFGGYGNDSGNQIIGGKQFYDLYRINLKTHLVKRCWNIEPRERFVPANNLILSRDKKYFYTLCYPHEIAKTSLRLYKFSVKDGSYQIVSAPIAVTSEKIETDINLFFNQKSDEFFCTIQEFTNPLHSMVRIYALTAPPVSMAVYLQSLHPKGAISPVWLAASAIAIGISVLIFALVLKLRNKKPQTAIPIADTEKQETNNPRFVKKRNAVYLLGDFAVFDHNSRDITYLFSPKIKQLFLLLLLHSKDGKGISSKKISQILWPDKDISKTKNLRGVTFNHLRSSISDLNGVRLSFVNDNYLFTISDDFFCDYFTLLGHIDELADIKNEEAGLYHALIKRGTLLPEMPDAWLDDFKQNYDETLLKTLTPQLDLLYRERNFKDILELARLILIIDPFNDEAFKYELKSIKMIKGIEHSKKIYDQFSHEYSKSIGENYPTSFDKALS